MHYRRRFKLAWIKDIVPPEMAAQILAKARALKRPSKLGLLLSFAMTALFSGGAAASTTQRTIASLIARSSDGLQAVTFNGVATTRPACAASTGYYLVKDENSTTGKTQYAQLLSAQLTGRSVYLVGTGTCTRSGDAEDILYVEILP